MNAIPPSQSLRSEKALPRHGFTKGRAAQKALYLAAESGDPDAQFNLGVICANRHDDSNDDSGGEVEAIAWLSEAAEHGLARAQARLAELYAREHRGARDQVKACAWFLIAAAGSTGVHRDNAEAGFERMASRLSPPQVALARRLARDWKPIAIAIERGTRTALRQDASSTGHVL